LDPLPLAQVEPGRKADYAFSIDFFVDSPTYNHVYGHEIIGNPIRKEKVLLHILSAQQLAELRNINSFQVGLGAIRP